MEKQFKVAHTSRDTHLGRNMPISLLLNLLETASLLREKKTLDLKGSCVSSYCINNDYRPWYNCIQCGLYERPQLQTAQTSTDDKNRPL